MPRLVKMHSFVRIRYKHMRIWDLKLANFYKTMVAPPPHPLRFSHSGRAQIGARAKKETKQGPNERLHLSVKNRGHYLQLHTKDRKETIVHVVPASSEVHSKYKWSQERD